MSKILENLYLGSYSDAKNKVFLKRNNITHIVTVGVELQTLYPETYKYLYIPAYDNSGYKLNAFFDQIADFIDNAIQNEKGNVFVHCYWGISRSTTSVLAYLIKYYKIPPLKARLFVKSKRPIIFPNEGFVNQLGLFAKKLGVLDKSNTERPIKTASTPMPLLGDSDVFKESSVFGVPLTPSVIDSDEVKGEQDFFCKVCGMKLFHTQDVVHNKSRRPDSMCTSVYLKYMPWMGYIKSNIAKVFCPNTKCNAILGNINKTGGRCSCGKAVEKMYSVFSSRLISAKAKPAPERSTPKGI